MNPYVHTVENFSCSVFSDGVCFSGNFLNGFTIGDRPVDFYNWTSNPIDYFWFDGFEVIRPYRRTMMYHMFSPAIENFSTEDMSE